MSVTPLTGQYATFGEELRRGAEMAVRDINERGGVNGQKLTLLTADDACDPELAVEIAEELARQRVVLVDGHFCSGASIAASRVYHERGVLMIEAQPRPTRGSPSRASRTSSASAGVTTAKAGSPRTTPSTTGWRTGSRSSRTRPRSARASPTSSGGG